MLSLDELGFRIAIFGPSSSGKSTLARSIGHKLDLPVIHLDQLRFVPGSDWVTRPMEEFEAAHDAAIQGERWVMEGNYSELVPRRLFRTTGIIMLQDWRIANLYRYGRRTLLERDRPGALEGGRDSLKLTMIRWILFGEPKRRGRRNKLLRDSGLPRVEVNSMRELNLLYARWGLRPSASP